MTSGVANLRRFIERHTQHHFLFLEIDDKQIKRHASHFLANNFCHLANPVGGVDNMLANLKAER